MRWGIAFFLGTAPVLVAALAAVLGAAPALAQNRSFCADRPGRGTPACTLGAGQAMVEMTAISFDRSYDPIAVTDTLALGDTLLRFGIDDGTEIQLGLTAFVDATSRDRLTRAPDRARSVGDGYAAIRRGIGPHAAVEVFFTLPRGKGAAGAGDWGAGVLLPIDIPAPADFTISLIPEVSAVPNASGTGRHLAFGGVAGLSHALSDSLAGGLELGLVHDDDPAGAGIAAQIVGSLA